MKRQNKVQKEVKGEEKKLGKGSECKDVKWTERDRKCESLWWDV